MCAAKRTCNAPSTPPWERFGGVDICVNNASAIATDPTEQLSAKKFDLMSDINVRGTFLLTKACLPHLRESVNPHVLTIAPPVNLNPYWLGAHPVYTLSKYGMSLLSLGWAEEFRQERGGAGIAFNCLWPETYIATAAVTNLADGDELAASSRSPAIMADAAVAIVSRPAREATGQSSSTPTCSPRPVSPTCRVTAAASTPSGTCSSTRRTPDDTK